MKKKSSKWKILFSPFFPDRYFIGDIRVGLGVTGLAMVGIFIVSLLELVGSSNKLKEHFYFSIETILSSSDSDKEGDVKKLNKDDNNEITIYSKERKEKLKVIKN
jgi:hypothetical protein